MRDSEGRLLLYTWELALELQKLNKAALWNRHNEGAYEAIMKKREALHQRYLDGENEPYIAPDRSTQ